MYNSALLLGMFYAATLAAPVDQHPLKHSHDRYPFKNDPWDRKHDTYGDGVQPLPVRNGDGTSVLGPVNKDRDRQNPDLVRPPSTDHGILPNLRWYVLVCREKLQSRLTILRF